MILTHWRNKKGKKDKQYLNIHNGFKPNGIWISVNNSWEDWLEGNWKSWKKGKAQFNVELSKDIKLFIIESKEQFLKKFKELTGKDYHFTDFESTNKFHEELKKEFDGMWLKSEPFYKHRLDFDFMYFYPWDCESICVWNAEKVKIF